MADVRALDDAVAALNAELNAALPGIVLDAAAIALREIAARAPVDTGALKRSIEEHAERSKSSAAAVVEVADSGQGGTEHYAVFDEYGTSHQPAQPFFRPGFEAAKPAMEQFIVNSILSIIQKNR
jgi:HK97 gp10 family phage protein